MNTKQQKTQYDGGSANWAACLSINLTHPPADAAGCHGQGHCSFSANRSELRSNHNSKPIRSPSDQESHIEAAPVMKPHPNWDGPAARAMQHMHELAAHPAFLLVQLDTHRLLVTSSPLN
jgi:hypothetical protein